MPKALPVKTPGRNYHKLLAALAVLSAVLAILVGQQLFFRLDVTRDKRFSVSGYSAGILDSLEADLHLTYYLTGDLRTLYPQTRDIADALATYCALKPLVTLRIADPAQEDLEDILAQSGIQSRQVQLARKNKTEFVEVYSAISLEYAGKTEVVPFILAPETLEYELDRRILNLLSDSAPAVYVLCGNGLAAPEDYSYALGWLDAAGFRVIVVTPDDFADDAPSFLSPGGLKNPLAVFGSAGLASRHVAAIETFVEAGGRAFFAASPNRADILDNWTVTPLPDDRLLPLLDAWGFSIGPALVLDAACFRLTLHSDDAQGQYQYRNYPLWINLLPQFSGGTHPAARNLPNMHVFWASPLTTVRNVTVPVLRTSPAAWLMIPDFDHDQVFVTNPFMVALSGSASGTLGQYTVAAASDGAGGSALSRVFVMADQYFAADLLMNYTGSSGNLDFLVNALLWLSGEEELLNVKNAGINTKGLYKKSEAELAAAQLPALLITGVLLPLALPCVCAILVRRRKRASQ
jgi:ABC-type uncharacterized transport system involved in gliding motility auxiliary subunit